MSIKASDKDLSKEELMKKANEWMDRAIDTEEKGKTVMSNKCLDKAVDYEAASLAK